MKVPVWRLIVAALLLMYIGGYAYARATHQLAWNGHSVADWGGLGFTTAEMLYAPLCATETVLRGGQLW